MLEETLDWVRSACVLDPGWVFVNVLVGGPRIAQADCRPKCGEEAAGEAVVRSRGWD